MRTSAMVLSLLVAVSLNAQTPRVTAAPPFTSMSRVPVTDFDHDVIPAAGRQERPAIATDGTNLMAVWADSRYGNFDVFASRLNQYGFPVDKLGIPVAPTYFDDFDPSIAWNGTDYGVVWATQYGLFFARISNSGIVSSPRKIFDTFVGEPRALQATAIAWTGGEYLVAFSYKEPNTTGATLDGLLVAIDGTLRSERFAISQPLTGATNPSIATDGTKFLIAWEEMTPRQVLTAIVSPEGTISNASVIGTAPATLPFCDCYTTRAFPEAAFNGSEYAVVWTDNVLRAQRISVGGAPIETARAISELTHVAITPSITAIGADWLVVWADSPNSPSGTAPQYGEDLSPFDIASTRVVRNLSSDSGINVVNADPDGQLQPAAALSTQGAVVLWQDLRMGADVRFAALTQADVRFAALTQAGVRFAALTQAGVPTGPNGTIAFSIANQKERAIAVSGDVALVVWKQQVNDSEWAAYWRRFRSDGTPLEQEPSIISWGDPVGFPPNADSVQVAASQDGFLLVFKSPATPSIIGIRVEREGNLLDPWGFLIADEGTAPYAASDGHDFLVAWSAPTARMDWLGRPLEEIRARHVTASGNVSRDVVIAPSSDKHVYNPVATWTGDKYAVAWSTFEQSVYPLTGLSMRYVGPAGEPAGEPFIVESVRHYGQQAESIASGGGLVAIGAGSPEYGSVYVVGGTVITQTTRVGPHVLWDSARFVSGDVPMASFGDGRNVAIGTELIRMLPASHAGGVNRVYVGFFNSLRTRAVRRN